MKSSQVSRRAEPSISPNGPRGLESIRALISLSKLDAGIAEDRRAMTTVEKQVEEAKAKVETLAAALDNKRKQLSSVVSLPPDVTPLAPPPDPQVLRDAVATAEKEWQEAVDDVAEKERSVKTLTAKLQKHIAELEAGRPELVASAPKELLGTYQHTLTAGRLPAMVPLTDTCCSACNLSLPLHMVYSVHHGSQVIRCAHCKRLLYSESWFEEPAAPAAATAPAKAAPAKAAVKG